MAKFIAKSDIGISVKVAPGVYKFVSFDLSSNGSTYITNNQAVINGLRKHSGYGRLFTELQEETGAPIPVAKSATKQAEEACKTIRVSSLVEAKDYLVEHFAISRTQLTSKAKIIAQGKTHKIEFDGI